MSSESYYSQRCYTCGVYKGLVHYHRAHTDRTCFECFAHWLNVPRAHASRVMAIHTLKLYHKLGGPPTPTEDSTRQKADWPTVEALRPVPPVRLVPPS